ncbi:MAG: hypothetical protein JWL69_91 [Phycisphaerales bacterium]|jgi:hypothetical protein|nr:hypothetical protein [Phycisphaerales bacterium]MDB5357256.1 hypothetical protein [Phycisphaerales bacterium]
MVSLVHDTEMRRLRELADEYRERGYRAVIYPGERELPVFLKGTRIDLLAEGPKEKVVVALAVADELSKSARITKLAKLLDDRAGWRFEVDVMAAPPRAEELEHDTSLRPLTADEIPSRLSEAWGLRQGGHSEAAHLLAWAAIEALMRKVLVSQGIGVRESVPSTLVKSLYSFGLVSKGDYEILRKALDQRNALVHGFRPANRQHLNTQALITVADKLAMAGIAG